MKKILSVAVVCAITLVIGCGCSQGEISEIAGDTTVHTIVVEDSQNNSQLDTETTAYPTGVPLNRDTYVEFTSPVAYTVIKDADAYVDTSVQTYARTYKEGTVVVGVATDDHYVILDDGSVVESVNLEEVS